MGENREGEPKKASERENRRERIEESVSEPKKRQSNEVLKSQSRTASSINKKESTFLLN